MQELLLEELARRANSQMQTQHRSTLQYKDVGTAFPFSSELSNYCCQEQRGQQTFFLVTAVCAYPQLLLSMTGRLSHSFQVRLHTTVALLQHVRMKSTCIAAKELDRLTSGPLSVWSACTADIVPQQVAVSTLLEKYRQQHPELVHVQPQPQPQVHQQSNGMTTPALWMLSMFSAAHFLLLNASNYSQKKSRLA